MNLQTDKPAIKTLSDIRQQKLLLQEAIKQDDQTIKDLWKGLFRKPDLTAATPSKRIQTFLSVGTGVVDSLILGWKLYHKFSNTPLLGGRKKRK